MEDNPVKILEDQLTALVARRDELRAEHAAALSALDGWRAQVIAGGGKRTGEQAVAAQSRVTMLSGAITLLDAQITQAESQLATARERQARAGIIARLHALAVEAEDARSQYATVLAELNAQLVAQLPVIATAMERWRAATASWKEAATKLAPGINQYTATWEDGDALERAAHALVTELEEGGGNLDAVLTEGLFGSRQMSVERRSTLDAIEPHGRVLKHLAFGVPLQVQVRALTLPGVLEDKLQRSRTEVRSRTAR